VIRPYDCIRNVNVELVVPVKIQVGGN
jgi:hypothetical protein